MDASQIESVDWHRLDAGEAAQTLASSAEGLTDEAARERLARYGPNALVEKRRKPVWRMLLDQFKDFMILVLIAAAVVAGLLGEPADTIAIVVIVLLNAVLGFVQEYRAEKAMAALKRMASPTATVIRGGHTASVATAELVPGDVVILEAGNVVPADLRLTEAVQLRVEEAALTGESVAVEKDAAALKEADLALGTGATWPTRGPWWSTAGAGAWSPAPACAPNWERSPRCSRIRTRDAPRCRSAWPFSARSSPGPFWPSAPSFSSPACCGVSRRC